jgi:flagellar basal body P-ring protein FlgI
LRQIVYAVKHVVASPSSLIAILVVFYCSGSLRAELVII